MYPSEKAQRQNRDGIVVRVIEYEIEGIEDPEPLYRLVTTLHDPREAPAQELAALYPQRWEIEGVLDEFKVILNDQAALIGAGYYALEGAAAS